MCLMSLVIQSFRLFVTIFLLLSLFFVNNVIVCYGTYKAFFFHTLYRVALNILTVITYIYVITYVERLSLLWVCYDSLLRQSRLQARIDFQLIMSYTWTQVQYISRLILHTLECYQVAWLLPLFKYIVILSPDYL